MTAIEEVATFVPAARTPIGDLTGPGGLGPTDVRVFQRYFGLREVARDPDGGLTHLLRAAADGLTGLRGREDRIRYLIHARTVESAQPYPVCAVEEVRDGLGLDGAMAFTVTQHACASGLLAVDLAGRLLAQDGDPAARALVLSGEKAFTADVRTIPETSAMGEASAAALVRLDGRTDRVLSYATRTEGRFHLGRRLPERLAEQFRAEYFDRLAGVVRAAVRRAGLRLADLAVILPHNVNRHSWIRLCQVLPFPVDRVLLTNVPLLGHCFCADPFLNYRTAVEAGQLRRGDRYLMASVGLGATFSAMVLQH
ncbi:3-oxoacyl-[acyl-carrier-protein] synthase III C-terminal domain-containing protein [Jidongwangia harbinensis]|uniref:3-oxoacyl-[acyl-carrier-protein] synthase III C-terminal domain-containing protein n=1 Tax=Jidongwangia harbinensis TaxID=2878561 RepID=UPI001CD94272|nr:3-oxoacyl-[acyl-carrier-protein] synthase III C-terminal domain-containing protein [Jidongwangia harbinensis]MCA2211345.1 3-oxoacyl-ACP synthase [Jidongwangia harbinensis]